MLGKLFGSGNSSPSVPSVDEQIAARLAEQERIAAERLALLQKAASNGRVYQNDTWAQAEAARIKKNWRVR